MKKDFIEKKAAKSEFDAGRATKNHAKFIPSLETKIQ